MELAIVNVGLGLRFLLWSPRTYLMYENRTASPFVCTYNLNVHIHMKHFLLLLDV